MRILCIAILLITVISASAQIAAIAAIEASFEPTAFDVTIHTN